MSFNIFALFSNVNISNALCVVGVVKFDVLQRSLFRMRHYEIHDNESVKTLDIRKDLSLKDF